MTGPKDSWPPPLAVVPPEPELTLPSSADCGEIIQGTEGRFEAPNYPNYTHNSDCAWVIEVPSGFYIEIHFPASGIERRYVHNRAQSEKFKLNFLHINIIYRTHTHKILL